mgnify:CR=1 FL=1
MTDFGESALVSLVIISALQVFASLFLYKWHAEIALKSAQASQYFQFFLIVFAFATQVHAYVVTDLSVFNVAMNTHRDACLLYKITGVWGNHEGSMLLWVTILSVAGAAVALFARAEVVEVVLRESRRRGVRPARRAIHAVDFGIAFFRWRGVDVVVELGERIHPAALVAAREPGEGRVRLAQRVRVHPRAVPSHALGGVEPEQAGPPPSRDGRAARAPSPGRCGRRRPAPAAG